MKKAFKNLSSLLLSLFLVGCNETTTPITDSKTESTSTSEKQSESSSTISESQSTSSITESSSSSVSESSTTTESSSSSESSPVESSSDNSADVPGIISLTNESNVASSIKYGDYDFKLVNVKEADNSYVTLSKGGYVLNTTPFGDIDSFKVEYSVKSLTGNQVQSDLGFGGLYYVTDTHKITYNLII